MVMAFASQLRLGFMYIALALTWFNMLLKLYVIMVNMVRFTIVPEFVK